MLPLLMPECGGGVTCSLRLVTPARRPVMPARLFPGEAWLGRALTPASLAEPWEADPRETRAGLSWGGWLSARPCTAVRGPRPADFLKGERTQSPLELVQMADSWALQLEVLLHWVWGVTWQSFFKNNNFNYFWLHWAFVAGFL